MTIRFDKDTHARLTDSIKRFFLEELDEDIGDLKADLVLGFFTQEIGPSVYNQALTDAQAFITEKVSDMGNVRFEPEFDFWKKR